MGSFMEIWLAKFLEVSWSKTSFHSESWLESEGCYKNLAVVQNSKEELSEEYLLSMVFGVGFSIKLFDFGRLLLQLLELN